MYIIGFLFHDLNSLGIILLSITFIYLVKSNNNNHSFFFKYTKFFSFFSKFNLFYSELKRRVNLFFFQQTSKFLTAIFSNSRIYFLQLKTKFYTFTKKTKKNGNDENRGR